MATATAERFTRRRVELQQLALGMRAKMTELGDERAKALYERSAAVLEDLVRSFYELADEEEAGGESERSQGGQA